MWYYDHENDLWWEPEPPPPTRWQRIREWEWPSWWLILLVIVISIWGWHWLHTPVTTKPRVTTADDLYNDYVFEWVEAHCPPEAAYPSDECRVPWPPADLAVYQAILDAPREGNWSDGQDPGGRYNPFSKDWR